MKTKRMVFIVMALAIVFVFVSCAPGAEKTEVKEEMSEQKTRIVYTLDGEEVNLLDGERTYVKAWASWCSICLSGLGELDELAASDTDFRVLSVVAPNSPGEMSEEDFKEWWAGLDYENIEVLFDRDSEFFNEVGVRAFPTSVYIGSNGEYAKSVVGHNANDFILETMNEIE